MPCDRCNCPDHIDCHIEWHDMGYQGLLLTGGKSSGFTSHQNHDVWEKEHEC